MKKRKLEDLSDGKLFHLINLDRKIGRIVGVISSIYICFLIWTVMTNFGIFAKAVFVTFVVLAIYFSICTILDIKDKIKRHKQEKLERKKNGWH
ncbi:hypothetical protein OZX69_03195 [Lactobacillus sp. ESL0731]|uniref:hypothetical protein n=1 Tax=unclassified Lactobacillus TaxID=2620435 RepID=UPI0023F84900|nr:MULTISPECIES: hypothetical protein [unclassified Lactobacillus]WEV51715.1 hypothetical protein OZX63_03195 [Lactobacillus sp. ESL0700]WEV62844.1 hypothetical protein OZX69_03195 [Lactobacillus sp. ESL0731]